MKRSRKLSWSFWYLVVVTCLVVIIVGFIEYQKAPMALEVVVAFVGLVIVGIGAWFYLGSDWRNHRLDGLLQYKYMAVPIGLSLVILSGARAGTFGPVTSAMVAVGLTLMALSWIFAYLKPRWLAPRWLRLRRRASGDPET